MRTTSKPRLLALVLGAVLACLFGARQGLAQYPNWCENAAPAPTPRPPEPPSPPCEPKECDKCTNSPCYVSSGTYVMDEQDLRIRTNGFPLVASRHYQSTLAIDGPLGIGWTSSVTSRVYYAVYLFSAPSTYHKEAYVIMPDGARYTFTDSGAGSFTPPVGRYDTLVRNADGSFDLTLQRTRARLHFGVSGSLESMTDDYGNALTVTFDGLGRVQQVADSSGSTRSLTVTWGPDGRIASIQDNSGRIVQYTYTAQGSLLTTKDAANRTTTYGYVQGRFVPLLTRITENWNRIVSDVTYDTADRVKTYTDKGETYTYTYAYQGVATTTAKADSQGNTFTYPFGASGLVSDVSGPDTPPTHTDYNPDGSILRFIDGTGLETEYLYNAQGSVTSRRIGPISDPNSVTWIYAYDSNFPEKVVSITPKDSANLSQTDLSWQAWRYDYYPVGSPGPGALFHVYRVRDDGTTLDTMATYVYDSQGRMTRSTTAAGGATDYGYDAAGNLTTVTAPANNDGGTRPVTSYAYDSLGRVTSVTDALNHATAYTYDALDRVKTVTLPKPAPASLLTFTTTYSYDNFDSPSGLLFTHMADANGRLTKTGYDQYGQLVKVIDASANATTYSYLRGLLMGVTDANGNTTSYGYDGARKLTSTTFPNGAAESYTYRGDNLLNSVTDRRNQTILYAYDIFKRMVTKDYPGAAYVFYDYTGQKLMQVDDNAGAALESHLFGYDSSYRVSTNTQAARGTINYQYNADDTVLSAAIQGGGTTTTYAYYPDGSLNTIGWSPAAGQFKYTYTLVGQYDLLTFPNGQKRDWSYDDQGRLLQIANTMSSGTNLANYAYGYDLNYTSGQNTMLGQRVAMTATVPAAGLSGALSTYEYDPLYQLTKVTNPAGAPFSGEVDTWAYDAIGNRITSTVNGTPTSLTYQKIVANPNNWQRLVNDGTNAYTYDANGSVATKAGAGSSYTYGYDVDNRQTSITGSLTASYTYDYQGRRSSKTVSGSTTAYLYDGLNIVFETGASPAYYLFGPRIDEPLAVKRGGVPHYYLADGLGSVGGITSAAAAVENSYVYGVWGGIRSQTGSLGNSFGYTGREFAEAGSWFYRSRYYSSSLGRFLSEDPLRFRGGSSSFYSYVYNGPLMWIDPLGLAGINGPCMAAYTAAGAMMGAGTGAVLGAGGGTLVAPGVGTIGGGYGGAAVGGAAGAAAGAFAGGIFCRDRTRPWPEDNDDTDEADPCWAQYEGDRASCRCLSDRRQRAICYRVANERYVNCVRNGHPGPPLPFMN